MGALGWRRATSCSPAAVTVRSMNTKTPKQERVEAIAEALSATDAVDEAEEDQDMEAFAQRFEAKVTQDAHRVDTR